MKIAVAALPAAVAAGVLVLSPVATARSGHCNLELVRDGAVYLPWHGPSESVQSATRLRGGAVLRCERTVVCKRNGACSYGSGKVVRVAQIARLAGVDPADAVLDVAERRVFVVPDRCDLRTSGVLRCETPSSPPSQWPPLASILTARGRVPLGWGFEFCWSTATGSDTSVQNCPLFLPPWLRPRALPVIASSPGATLRFDLEFNPYAVVIAVDRTGVRYVSETLAPARMVEWRVPSIRLHDTGYVDLYAVRLFDEQPRDFVHYAARIRIAR